MSLIILIGFTISLVAFLPEKRSKRVHDFVKMLLNLMPISKALKSLSKKKSDK